MSAVGEAAAAEIVAPVEHPAGRQGAVGLGVALSLIGLCAYLPIDRDRSFFDEMKRSGPSAVVPLGIAFLPLLVGAATLVTRARQREPGKALVFGATGVAALQSLALALLAAIALRESHRDREYALALSFVAAAAAPVWVLWRGRRLSPWPRLAHVLAGLSLQYLPIAVAMMYELGRERSGPLGVDLYLAASGVMVPFFFWVVWPPRWRAAPAAKR